MVVIVVIRHNLKGKFPQEREPEFPEDEVKGNSHKNAKKRKPNEIMIFIKNLVTREILMGYSKESTPKDCSKLSSRAAMIRGKLGGSSTGQRDPKRHAESQRTETSP